MTMPIDLRQVDWLYVAILAFFASRKLGSGLIVLSTPWARSVPGSGAVCRSFRLLDVLPHGLPLPTTLRAQKSTAATTTNLPAERRPPPPHRGPQIR